ncbi:MAG: hypothetical protein U0361_15625 [Nitrospiraceae bacterium]
MTDTGAKTAEAGPSIPVEVIDRSGVPAAGDLFTIVKDERVAREIAEERARKQRAAEFLWPDRPRSAWMTCLPRFKKAKSKNFPS